MYRQYLKMSTDKDNLLTVSIMLQHSLCYIFFKKSHDEVLENVLENTWSKRGIC